MPNPKLIGPLSLHRARVAHRCAATRCDGSGWIPAGEVYVGRPALSRGKVAPGEG